MSMRLNNIASEIECGIVRAQRNIEKVDKSEEVILVFCIKLCAQYSNANIRTEGRQKKLKSKNK